MSPRNRRSIGASTGLVLVALCGCAVDLLVGGAETSTGTGSETRAVAEEGMTTAPPVTTEGVGDSSSGSTRGTITSSSSGEATSTGLEPGTTSTGAPAESSTGDLPCEGQNAAVCNELEYCLWYPDSEECLPSPCVDPMHECLELMFKPCVDAIICAWQEMPEGCFPIECVPCELLELAQCMEVPTCVWDEMEMFCDMAPV